MPQYGEMFQKGEVVLLYFHKKPTVFARVESVSRDRKKGWWKTCFLALTLPLKKMEWILDDDQMRGEPFTMDGHPIRIERVPPSEEEADIVIRGDSEDGASEGGRIVAMFDDE